MSAPKTPPPGSVPSPFASPDMQSMMTQLGGQGKQGGSGAQLPGGMPGQANPSGQKAPRPVGSIPQEGKYFVEDVAAGVVGILPDIIQEVLGLKSSDTPEEAERKKQMLQRFQALNARQQKDVQKRLQEDQVKKQKEEEEKMLKAKKEQQKPELVMPTGKTQGAGAGTPGQSKAKSFMDDFNKKRQQLSNAA